MPPASLVLPTADFRRAGNVTARGFGIPDGPLLIEVRRFADARGSFAETYSRADFAAIGIEAEFVQDNASHSVSVGTVRGLHFQVPPRAQAKLVRVLAGAILDVAVDLREGSPTFGRHVAVRLEAGDGRMLFVPEGFAHGFCTTQPDTEVAYKVTEGYAPAQDRSLRWNDPALGISWPVAADAAVLSAKDADAPLLREMRPVPFVFAPAFAFA